MLYLKVLIAIIMISVFAIKYLLIQCEKPPFSIYIYFAYYMYMPIFQQVNSYIDYIFKALLVLGLIRSILNKFRNIDGIKLKFNTYEIIFYLIVLFNGICFNSGLGNSRWHDGIINLSFIFMVTFYMLNEITTRKKLESLFYIISINSLSLFVFAVIDRFILGFDRAGLYYNPNYLAQNLIFAMVCYYYVTKKKNSLKSFSYYLLMIIAIWLSGSHSVFMSLLLLAFIGFVLMFKSRRLYIVSIVSMAIVVVTYMVIIIRMGDISIGILKYAVKSSDSSRVVLWQYTYDIFKQHPLVGVGYNTFRAVFINQEMVTHNDYLRILVETGIGGFLIFITYIVNQIRKILYCDESTVFFLSSMIIITLSFSLTHNYIAHLFFWLALALPSYNFFQDKSII